jgi:hypothetical protein
MVPRREQSGWHRFGPFGVPDRHREKEHQRQERDLRLTLIIATLTLACSKTHESLFPEHKPLDFLMERKRLMSEDVGIKVIEL